MSLCYDSSAKSVFNLSTNYSIQPFNFHAYDQFHVHRFASSNKEVTCVTTDSISENTVPSLIGEEVSNVPAGVKQEPHATDDNSTSNNTDEDRGIEADIDMDNRATSSPSAAALGLGKLSCYDITMISLLHHCLC